MRYKGGYRPSYILGIRHPYYHDQVTFLIFSDPVSYTWNPLNANIFQRLSARRFVSLALDQHLRVPANPDELSLFLESSLETGSDLLKPLEMRNVKYARAIDYVKENAQENEETPDGVFEASMPGALSLVELREQTDLDNWLVRLGDHITTLEVSFHVEASHMTIT